MPDNAIDTQRMKSRHLCPGAHQPVRDHDIAWAELTGMLRWRIIAKSETIFKPDGNCDNQLLDSL